MFLKKLSEEIWSLHYFQKETNTFLLDDTQVQFTRKHSSVMHENNELVSRLTQIQYEKVRKPSS